MPLRLRPDDKVNPDDDLVLRAGGGDVDALTRNAIENAWDYEHLAAHQGRPVTVHQEIQPEAARYTAYRR